MAERSLSNSTDISTNLHIMKEPTPLETHNVNSSIRRSLSNKLNILAVTPPPLMAATSSLSTASLAVYCIETDSVVQQSLTNITVPITMTSIEEDRLFNDDDDKRQEPILDVEKICFLSDSENDSFDDDDETVITDSLYSQSFIIPSICIFKTCPICLELAALQSSSCCTFHSCNSCWRAHISTTINDGRIKITCISNECNKYLSRESILNLIRYDLPLHERYFKLYTNLNQNPRAKTCPRCSHLYSLDTIKSISLKKKIKNKKIPKQVQCSECSLVWCYRCSAPWHENLTCKQFIKGDKLLLKWINQKNEDQWNARKCPKCSSIIQRAGGCPHMTCQSCSCEFCYLCGRRYIKIPLIGQHNNKFSMFGCPYNLHPERPWLRRTIRGMIAAGVVVASPIIVAGAVTAAVTVLPSFGVYKLVKHIRSRRHLHAASMFPRRHGELLQDHELLQFHLQEGDFTVDDLMRISRLHSQLALRRQSAVNEEINDDFPLAIFADMDVEHLFIDDLDKAPLDFRTCPTTPAIDMRKGESKSLNNLTTIDHSTINRHHSITVEH